MVKQTIKIFCRVKPTKNKTGIYSIEEDEIISKAKVEFVLPKDSSEGYINNKRESYSFGFQKVFDQQVKQDLIFEHVAEGVVDNVLSGYNGTIFAYGQTGSGKTFTITGGAEKYDDRGIIPRALSYIFQKYEEDKDHIYTTEVSYLEIYNESGFDLLDPRHEATKLEDLPKVALMEDPDQNIHLKNLSLLPAQNEEDALNLLFLGDTNRMIAETPMNQASTRSHCIFTIHVTSREPGSATIKRSKLHLVDLAGSERVSKSGVAGHLLTEAKYINLSLHYLEQVIVALSEKKRQHIPYRNSMMTSVLRDSLGGNCMTTMIATVAVDRKNVDESISTCRFAQRVAMIKNEATLNEELDPKLMILRLKKEVQTLKDELSLATGEQRTDQLTPEEIEKLNECLKIFLEDDDLESSLDVGGDMRKIQYCYKFLKDEARKHPPQALPSPPPEDKQIDEQPNLSPAEIQRLREILQQRDNEISILVSMLKKERKRALDAENRSQMNGSNAVSHSQHGFNATSTQNTNRPVDIQTPESANIIQQKSRVKDIPMSMGKQEAFEIFKRDYTSDTNVLEQKELLKHRYSEAKSLGQAVNRARNDINHLKASLNHVRKQMESLNDEEDSFEEHEKEQSIIHQMEEAKSRYKSAFQKLKSMKAEIDHLHHLMDKARVQMQHDFDDWWNLQSKSRQPKSNSRPSSHVESNRHHAIRNAWRTPPISPAKVPPIGNRSSGEPPMSLPPTTLISPREMPREQSIRSSNNILTQRRDNSGHQFSGTDIIYSNRDRYSSNSETERSSYSRPPSAARSAKSTNGIPLTGDKDTDADIIAFVKARESMMKRQQQKGR